MGTTYSHIHTTTINLQYANEGNNSSTPTLSSKVDDSLKFDAEVPVSVSGLNPVKVNTRNTYSELLDVEYYDIDTENDGVEYDGIDVKKVTKKIGGGIQGAVRWINKHRDTIQRSATSVDNILLDLDSLFGGMNSLPRESREDLKDFYEYSNEIENKFTGDIKVKKEKAFIGEYGSMMVDEEYTEDTEVGISEYYEDDDSFGYLYDSPGDPFRSIKDNMIIRKTAELTRVGKNNTTNAHSDTKVNKYLNRPIKEIKTFTGDDVNNSVVGVGIKTLHKSVGSGLSTSYNMYGLSCQASSDVGGAILQSRFYKIIPSNKLIGRIRSIMKGSDLHRASVHMSLRGSEYGVHQYVTKPNGEREMLPSHTSMSGVVTQMIGNKKTIYGKIHEIESRLNDTKRLISSFNQDLFVIPINLIDYHTFNKERIERCNFNDIFWKRSPDYEKYSTKVFVYGFDSIFGRIANFHAAKDNGNVNILHVGNPLVIKNWLIKDLSKKAGDKYVCQAIISCTVRIFYSKEGETVVSHDDLHCGFLYYDDKKLRVKPGKIIDGDGKGNGIFRLTIELSEINPWLPPETAGINIGNLCICIYSNVKSVGYVYGIYPSDMDVTLYHTNRYSYFLKGEIRSETDSFCNLVGTISHDDYRSSLDHGVENLWFSYIDNFSSYVASIADGINDNRYPLFVTRMYNVFLKIWSGIDFDESKKKLIKIILQLKFWMMNDHEYNELSKIGDKTKRECVSTIILFSLPQLIKDYAFHNLHDKRIKMYDIALKKALARAAYFEN